MSGFRCLKLKTRDLFGMHMMLSWPASIANNVLGLATFLQKHLIHLMFCFGHRSFHAETSFGFSCCTFRSILWILSPIGFSPELRVVNPSGLATLDSTQSSQPPNQNVGSLEFLWWLMQLMCHVRHEEIATVLSGFT